MNFIAVVSVCAAALIGLCGCATLAEYLLGNGSLHAFQLHGGLSVVAPNLLNQPFTSDGPLHTRTRTADRMLAAYKEALGGDGSVHVDWMDAGGSSTERLQWLSPALAAYLRNYSSAESLRISSTHIALALVVPLQWNAIVGDSEPAWSSKSMQSRLVAEAIKAGLLPKGVAGILQAPEFHDRRTMADLWRIYRVILAVAYSRLDVVFSRSLLAELPSITRSQVMLMCVLTKSRFAIMALLYLLNMAEVPEIYHIHSPRKLNTLVIGETIDGQLANRVIQRLYIATQIGFPPVEFPQHCPTLVNDLFDVLLATMIIFNNTAIIPEADKSPAVYVASKFDAYIMTLERSARAPDASFDIATSIQVAASLVYACITMRILLAGYGYIKALPTGLLLFLPSDFVKVNTIAMNTTNVFCFAEHIRSALVARAFACGCGVAVANPEIGRSWTSLLNAERLLSTGIVSRPASFQHALQFLGLSKSAPAHELQLALDAHGLWNGQEHFELGLLKLLHDIDVQNAILGIAEYSQIAQYMYVQHSNAYSIESLARNAVLGHDCSTHVILPKEDAIAFVLNSVAMHRPSWPLRDVVYHTDSLLCSFYALCLAQTGGHHIVLHSLVAYNLLTVEEASIFADFLFANDPVTLPSFTDIAQCYIYFCRWRDYHKRGNFSSISIEISSVFKGAFTSLLPQTSTISASGSHSESGESVISISFWQYLIATLAICAWKSASIVLSSSWSSNAVGFITVGWPSILGWSASIIHHFTYRTTDEYVAVVRFAVAMLESSLSCKHESQIVSVRFVPETEPWSCQARKRLEQVLNSGGYVRYGMSAEGPAEFLHAYIRPTNQIANSKSLAKKVLPMYDQIKNFSNSMDFARSESQACSPLLLESPLNDSQVPSCYQWSVGILDTLSKPITNSRMDASSGSPVKKMRLHPASAASTRATSVSKSDSRLTERPLSGPPALTTGHRLDRDDPYDISTVSSGKSVLRSAGAPVVQAKVGRSRLNTSRLGTDSSDLVTSASQSASTTKVIRKRRIEYHESLYIADILLSLSKAPLSE